MFSCQCGYVKSEFKPTINPKVCPKCKTVIGNYEQLFVPTYQSNYNCRIPFKNNTTTSSQFERCAYLGRLTGGFKKGIGNDW